MVQRGDLIKVYAVSYNPVSYSPQAPQSAVLEPEDVPGIQILAALLGHVGKLAMPAPPAAMLEARSAFIGNTDACALGSGPLMPSQAEACLIQLVDEVVALDGHVQTTMTPYVQRAERLEAFTKAIPRKLIHPAVGSVVQPGHEMEFFDSELLHDTTLNGTGLAHELEVFSDAVDQIATEVGVVLAGIGQLDAAVARTCASQACDKTFDEVEERLKQFHALVDVTLGRLVYAADKPFNHVIAKALQSVGRDLKTLVGYRRQLDPSFAGNYAIEITPPTPTKTLSVIVVTLPLQTKDERDKETKNQTLSLSMVREHPLVLASAGLGAVLKPFDYQTLALSQQAPSGTPPALSQTLIAVDDKDGISSFPPIIFAHVRLKEAFYASLGTTPNHDIFDNVFVGLSYHKPEWRSLITVGAVRAKGATKEDVEAIIPKYAPDGKALDDTDVSKIDTHADWHWRVFVSWSFHPF